VQRPEDVTPAVGKPESAICMPAWRYPRAHRGAVARMSRQDASRADFGIGLHLTD
jgi:hypothetical protein